MSMDHVKQIFISEAQEQLDVMEQCLLDVESGDVGIDQYIDAIFRSAHTVKGSAGLFGYENIVSFAHRMESVLAEVRTGVLRIDKALAETLLDSHSYLKLLIGAVSSPENAPQSELGKRLEQDLQSYLPNTDIAEQQAVDIVVPQQEPETWLIHVIYSEEVFRDGMDPASQLNYLGTLGEVVKVEIQPRFPHWQEYQAEVCYLTLVIEFLTAAAQDEIEDVFEFIRDTSQVSVVKKEEARGAKFHLDNLEPGLNESELSIEHGETTAEDEQKGPIDNQYLKVDAGKLDHLINLVGELITSNATNEMLAEELNNEPLMESLSQTAQLVEKIRDDALGLRLVKMKDTFHRLKRIVRDVAKDQGKDVQLHITGADTELDKTIVDRLIDPLMHLVRNAIDHGIESRAVRLRNGKNERGNISIRAYHESGTFIIEIDDDGAGINQSRLVEKAIDAGIITLEQPLSGDEINQLIFAPGLSTAETVTTVSGRGVGMDVVKRDIENLRGQIKVMSAAGRGTHFKIRLPLTLAIIDGFEVMVGDTHLVIPSNLIRGCLPFDAKAMSAEHDILDLRGEIVPFLRMNDFLNIQFDPAARKNMVIVQFGSQKAGILVEELRGEIQAVVKPLNAIFRALKGVGGSTILRAGDIGFILDIPQLIQVAANKESAYLQSHRDGQLIRDEND
ncbi:Signal transduction histidine kinase [Vibrio sp. B1FLJ16]|uniref:chemotaxis protein CheA n=1 Tax=Vibrio sp. B1FLJ16 TaxID=2751178 RepID=UPI0015F459E5|nr:chemotaxis protein CheA [Vibrio sp. B1FLJ16]CAD7800280.1 Signal transduction histidine kinase [Vibrio sp. B1FLJ16]CAE6887363.1 Signal transduction histidine kinase [Vibrio sp. B1FLJ16]